MELASGADLKEAEPSRDACFAKIQNDLLVIKWMRGVVLALQVGIFVKLFMP